MAADKSLFILLLVLGLVATQGSALAGPDEETSRVVVLNSTDPYLPAFLVLDDAVREAVRDKSMVPVDFFAETLDMHRFERDRYENELVALLQKKYEDLHVDVVVATASIALDFVRRHQDEIWPGAAIVFHSVPTDALGGLDLGVGTIGVPVRLEIGPTIDLALSLMPATKRIAVVAGTADSDLASLARARTALGRHANTIEVQYLAGLPLAETVEAVQSLPSDAVVIYLTMFRDGDGAPLVPREVLTRLAAVSPAPVFGGFETYLGHGIAAGSIASYAVQGRMAGELVARVLNGEDPAGIGVQTAAVPGCLADWRQLRRWGIDASRLPPGCELRFREMTVWRQYRWQILAVLAVILAQAALIVALTANRRRLRRATVALQGEQSRRSDAETVAASLRERLARFSKERSLGVMASAVSHEINQPLIAIQNYAQAARGRVRSDVDDKPKLIELFAKIEGQAERAGAITQRVRSLVSNNEPVFSPASLPSLLDEVIGLMEPEFENQDIRVDCKQDESLPAVRADALEIQLVFVNLLQNAIRAVEDGEAHDKTISIDMRAIGNDVEVSVVDRGPGVAPDRTKDIFEPMYTATTGGMGMGLNICSTIIEAHGGRIWHEPNPAGGAIFRFTLQAAAT